MARWLKRSLTPGLKNSIFVFLFPLSATGHVHPLPDFDAMRSNQNALCPVSTLCLLLQCVSAYVLTMHKSYNDMSTTEMDWSRYAAYVRWSGTKELGWHTSLFTFAWNTTKHDATLLRKWMVTHWIALEMRSSWFNWMVITGQEKTKNPNTHSDIWMSIRNILVTENGKRLFADNGKCLVIDDDKILYKKSFRSGFVSPRTTN